MFDIGFWELVMVGVVALIVVGPERLPGLARTAGLWLGKARYFVSSVKAEIDREIKAEELRRILAEHARLPEVDKFIEETRQGLSAVHEELNAAIELVPASTTPASHLSAAGAVLAPVALDDIPDNLRDAFSDEVSTAPVAASVEVVGGDSTPSPASTATAEATVSAPITLESSPISLEPRPDESPSQ
ncbi:Sec-independent protein translocase protein TatB [Gammaproteobacteria bacterium]